MKTATRLILAAFLAIYFLQPAVVSGLTIDQVDTFEDGTTQNWIINLLGMATPPAVPMNIAAGGPAGVDDKYLQLTAVGGAGAASRLTVINTTQWAGDYTNAGIAAIGMDLKNFSAIDLSIRLYLENPMAAPPSDTAVTDAFLLPAGGDWVHTEFAIDPASLITLTGDVNTLLSDVTALRIFHNPAAQFPGPPVVAVLGVDNITALPAVAVPEPSLFMLLNLGFLGLLAWKRRK